jgi:dipeptidyl aminopeptidase/acylaminoacyl peptidase
MAKHIHDSRFRVGGILVNAFHASHENLGRVPVFVWCYGFPGSPPTRDSPMIHRLVHRGWLVLCPEYPGTYGSYGKHTFDNAVDAPLAAVRLARRGHAPNVRQNTRVRWRAKRIVLGGGSYGGAVALVASLRTRVQDVAVFAPVARYRGRRRALRYRRIIKRAFENVWRIPDSAWSALVRTGSGLNPLDRARELARKRIFLAQCADDESVPVEGSRELVQKVRAAGGEMVYLELPRGGHRIGPATARIWPGFVRWLRG